MTAADPVRRPRWRRWLTRLLIGLIILGAVIGVPLAITVHHYGAQDGAAPADVIIVLGAGVEPDGRPTPAQARRVIHAAALYHAGYAENIICTGGTAPGRPISEAALCADLLAESGVPRAAIWIEDVSLSTEENAIESARIMQAEGWGTALVTSDNYHLWRARLLFELRGVTLSGTSPAQASTGPIGLFDYGRSLAREVAALVWQAVIDALGLPFTRL